MPFIFIIDFEATAFALVVATVEAACEAIARVAFAAAEFHGAKT